MKRKGNIEINKTKTEYEGDSKCNRVENNIYIEGRK
jgi:hypothetical protein